MLVAEYCLQFPSIRANPPAKTSLRVNGRQTGTPTRQLSQRLIDVEVLTHEFVIAALCNSQRQRWLASLSSRMKVKVYDEQTSRPIKVEPEDITDDNAYD